MNSTSPSPQPTFGFQAGEREMLDERLREQAAALVHLVIAIDGPAGSGKSSTARAVARRLGLAYLDTGAMYRALTLVAIRAGVDPADEAALVELAGSHTIGFEAGAENSRVIVDGEDVSGGVRSPQVNAAVSRIAAHPGVRRVMVEKQRLLGAGGGVVLDGRDIGTVVFPNADLKVFVTADARTRAERRRLEDAARGVHQTLAAIEADIRRRDAEDTERATAPLARAADAVLLDTTALDFEAQVDAVLALAVRVVRAAGTRGETNPPLVRLRPVDPEDARQPGYRAWHSQLHRVVRTIIHALSRVWFGQRTWMHPSVRLPGSALVACNHIGAFDPPLCGASAPFECWYVSKLELFRSGPLARLISRFNAVPIHRGTADYAALDNAVDLLQRGRNVFMFPEGTRQKPGRLGNPKWGFGYVAVKAGRPVVPMFVRGTRDTRPRGLRRESLQVWMGEPVTIEVTPGADPHAAYKQVGDLVMERIAGLMLRSAALSPLPGLELPGHYAKLAQVVTTTPSEMA